MRGFHRRANSTICPSNSRECSRVALNLILKSGKFRQNAPNSKFDQNLAKRIAKVKITDQKPNPTFQHSKEN
ncbi:hypothetical protein AAMO2058_000889300 [Amorphochlora amoebiformis]